MNPAIHGDAAGLLREAIAITGNMLEAASSGDWETVMALERERAPLIAQGAQLSAEIATLLQELQGLNHELAQLTDVARLATASLAADARYRDLAVETYGQTGLP